MRWLSWMGCSSMIVLGLQWLGAGYAQTEEASSHPKVLPVPSETAGTARESFHQLRFEVLLAKSGADPLTLLLRKSGLPSPDIQVRESPEELGLRSDVLVLAPDYPMTGLPPVRRRLIEFVERGGICWITHTSSKNWEARWLPEHLQHLRLLKRSLDDLGIDWVPFSLHLIPWLSQRTHPLWHKPHYLDEADFVTWKVHGKEDRWGRAADEVVTDWSGWRVLARYRDRKLKDGALILEAPWGRGLFFWSQILWPDGRRLSGEHRRFFENLWDYFHDFRSGRLVEVAVEVEPWSVAAGEPVHISGQVGARIGQTAVTVWRPDGKKEQAQQARLVDGIFSVDYTPEVAGEHTAVVRVQSGDAEGVGHGHFKVTKGWTPYRFYAHTHVYPESLNAIYAVCRRLRVDAAILALLGPREEMETTHAEIEELDSPRLRFLYGLEVHPNYSYTPEKDGVPQNNPDGITKRHFQAFPLDEFYPYSEDRYERRDLDYCHQRGAISIVAHPYLDPWWMTEDFEGIEFDRTDLRNWDAMLKAGRKVVGLSGVDNASGLGSFLWQGPNTAWLDEPFTPEALLRAILQGRVSKLSSGPEWHLPRSLPKVPDTLVFSALGQPVGTTVYVVDKVTLAVKVRCRNPVQVVKLLKDGQVIERLEPNARAFEWTKDYSVGGEGYYRLEVSTTEEGQGPFDYTPYRVPGVTNPIWVKLVSGPPGAAFCLFSNSQPKWNGRIWECPPSEVCEVSFDRGLWRLVVDAPAPGHLCVQWQWLRGATVNGQPARLVWEDGRTRARVVLPVGRSTVQLRGDRIMKQGGHAVWIADTLRKVFWDDPPSARQPAEGVEISAARNEREPIQLVVTAGRAIERLRVEVSMLTHESGQFNIRPERWNCRFVGYVPIRSNSVNTPPDELARPAPGYFPDPLLDDPSIRVEAGVSQPVWLTVHVPIDAVPGRYRGQVAIFADQEVYRMPVSLRVWNFALEDQPHVYFGHRGISLLHLCEYCQVKPWSPEHWRLIAQMLRNLRAHRHTEVPVDDETLLKIRRQRDGTPRFDFSQWDRFVELAMREGMVRFEGGMVALRKGWEEKKLLLSPWFRIRRPDGEVAEDFAGESWASKRGQEFLAAYLSSLQQHLEQRGWLDQFMINLSDEPTDECREEYVKLAAFAHRVAPKLRYGEAIYTKDLRGALEVWIPNIEVFVAEMDFFLREKKTAGLELWLHTSGSTTGKLPGTHIDMPLHKIRLLFWIVARYELDGYFRWGWNAWAADPWTDPHQTSDAEDPLSVYGPGDNFVVYPRPGQLLDSLRWETMREGMEDYEYLWTLRQVLAKAQQAGLDVPDPAVRVQEFCDRLVRTPTDYSRDRAAFFNVRQEIAEEIERVNRSDEILPIR